MSDPHIKNRVVITANGATYDEAGAAADVTGEEVFALVIAIRWGARQVDLVGTYEFGHGLVQAS